MSMNGPVTMLNTYIRNRAAARLGLPAHCQVFGVSVKPATAAPATSRMPIVKEDYTQEEFLAELKPKKNEMDDF